HGDRAPGAVDRRGCGNAPCHGDCRLLRHAGRHRIRPVSDPGVLCAAAPARPPAGPGHRTGHSPHSSSRYESVCGTALMIERFAHTAAPVLLAALLAGCATAPHYERPAVDVPTTFKEASLSPAEQQRWKQAQPADDLARGRWWAIFKDPALDALQTQAMQANQDLQAAAARVKQARAL